MKVRIHPYLEVAASRDREAPRSGAGRIRDQRNQRRTIGSGASESAHQMHVFEARDRVVPLTAYDSSTIHSKAAAAARG